MVLEIEVESTEQRLWIHVTGDENNTLGDFVDTLLKLLSDNSPRSKYYHSFTHATLTRCGGIAGTEREIG